MKKVLICCFTVFTAGFVYAQRCPQWPADCPETGFIEQSQSREIRIGNLILPQEVDMQDKMRTIFVNIMQQASEKTGWPMVELSEYTNQNAMQGGGTPYNLRSPRGILITFQFVVDPQLLSGWKTYETDYEKKHLDDETQDYHNITAATESPLYKQYKDSADHYMNLYTTYVEQHKDEGVALYTKDKHPKYYQQKESEFIDKMTAMTNGQHEDDGIEQKENEHDLKAFQFRNNTVIQVTFGVNSTAAPINQSLGPIEYHSLSYPLPAATVARIITIPKQQTNGSLVKWNNIVLIALGNFITKPDQYGYYQPGFSKNNQNDEHTPKKIKSDNVQNISITISGDKTNVEKMAKLIDVDKLNSTIVKF